MSFRILLDGVERQVDILQRRPHLVLSVDGRTHVVEDAGPDGDGLIDLTVAGQSVTVARADGTEGQSLRIAGRTHHATLLVEGEGPDDAAEAEIRAPMPGAVVEIHVAAGAIVDRGAALVTMESMKLQTVLGAPRDGVVAEVHVTEGQTFDKDQLLVSLEAREGTDADA
ncbi:biotin/lipoyl-containing protein [Chachezhania sediminis]|uniref:biotin/lipoyl-containing protein n=1 Tax=Chachezhania sediminis TaxID=2599291 RepID=UPI00131BC91E|nr:biotin/lipoyl-containing protein [Chachezhania sediminis]